MIIKLDENGQQIPTRLYWVWCHIAYYLHIYLPSSWRITWWFAKYCYIFFHINTYQDWVDLSNGKDIRRGFRDNELNGIRDDN